MRAYISRESSPSESCFDFSLSVHKTSRSPRKPVHDSSNLLGRNCDSTITIKRRGEAVANSVTLSWMDKGPATTISNSNKKLDTNVSLYEDIYTVQSSAQESVIYRCLLLFLWPTDNISTNAARTESTHSLKNNSGFKDHCRCETDGVGISLIFASIGPVLAEDII